MNSWVCEFMYMCSYVWIHMNSGTWIHSIKSEFMNDIEFSCVICNMNSFNEFKRIITQISVMNMFMNWIFMNSCIWIHGRIHGFGTKSTQKQCFMFMLKHKSYVFMNSCMNSDHNFQWIHTWTLISNLCQDTFWYPNSWFFMKWCQISWIWALLQGRDHILIYFWKHCEEYCKKCSDFMKC